MRFLTATTLAFAVCLLTTSRVVAQDVPVRSGFTNVLLDPDALALAGLSITGIGGDTEASSALPGGVKFPIAANSTFLYTAGTVLPVSGSIEHSGTVLLNSGPPANLGDLEIGDFSIRYDVSRADIVPGATGFFVSETFLGLGPAFDLADLDITEASTSAFVVAADLLLSPELADTLQVSNLAGADVGDALVEGAIPEPASAFLALGVIFAILLCRKTRHVVGR